GVMGLKKAIEYAGDIGIQRIWKRIIKLAEKLRWELADLPGITIHDLGDTKGGIVTFTVDSVSAKQVKKQLS
ncbi:MAG: aminotransferase class V-fold PLP-dependent enzyme, partial [Aliifodinibius sp.]|nr:aminotransferase class V-fold PLP-dependent enzyme [Fodinibius sp.]